MKNDEWIPISTLPTKDGYYWLKLKNGHIIKRFYIHDGLHRFYGVKIIDIESWKPV
jgi:hypothetical protein